MVVLLCGLSGAGKTTLAKNVKKNLVQEGIKIELIDGDEYRKTLCKDLSYTKKDRIENIRRLGFIAAKLSRHGVVSIISAIAPYYEMRKELKTVYRNVKIVYIDCPVDVLIDRDTKGLYKRAMLPSSNPDKLLNLTGINDQFDAPQHPDLYINTAIHSIEEGTLKLYCFIKQYLPVPNKSYSSDYSQNF